MRISIVVALVLATGCTTLGPMSATTGVSAVPAGRPDAEIAFSGAPGYYLSAGTTNDPDGAVLGLLTVILDPDRLLFPGLVVALRDVESDGTAAGYIEPIVGYRTALSESFAGAFLLYGTHAQGEAKGARYSATRFGAEVQADWLITGRSKWAELHLSWGAALTGLDGDGHYCIDSEGFGTDCPTMGGTQVDTVASGLYLSGNASLALELFRHHESWFHGIRATFGVAGGTMPTWKAGAQRDAAVYTAAGASLAIAFGAYSR